MRWTHTFVAIGFSAIATISPAFADCDRPRSALVALKQSDAAFRGTARDVKTAGEPAWSYAPFPKAVLEWHAWIVTFDVSQVWKGSVGKQFILHVAQNEEDDAFEGFDRASEYLVFAKQNSSQKSAIFHEPGPTYGATHCGGTTPLLLGMRYLIDLGPGKSP